MNRWIKDGWNEWISPFLHPRSIKFDIIIPLLQLEKLEWLSNLLKVTQLESRGTRTGTQICLTPKHIWLFCLTLLPHIIFRSKELIVKSEASQGCVFQALEQLILQFVALGHGDVEEAKRWHQSFGGLTSFLCYGPLIFPALNYMLSYFPLRTNNILCPQGDTLRPGRQAPGR